MKICFTIQQRKIMLGLIRPSFVQFCCKSKDYIKKNKKFLLTIFFIIFYIHLHNLHIFYYLDNTTIR